MQKQRRNCGDFSILRRTRWIHFLIIFLTWGLVLLLNSIQNFIFLGVNPAKIGLSFFIFPSTVGIIFGLLLVHILIFRERRKEYDLALARQEEEAKYRHFIENSGDAIYLLYEGYFEFVNPKFIELFGLTLEEINQSRYGFLKIIAPESRPFIEERIAQQLAGKATDLDYTFKAFNKKGELLELETSVTYIKYKDGLATQGVIRDITEKKRLEEQLRQALKMEAIGTLAGGVAHDFNNLLTVINGYSELALLKLEQGKIDYLPTAIEAIAEAGKRAEDLTRQLLAFSRKQVYKPEILDLNDVIKDIDKMLRRLLDADIDIESIFAKELPKIKADRSQLEQIFMNLVLNARDALNASEHQVDSKKITIETGEACFDETPQHIDLKKGKYLFFSVSDNGIGMSKEVRQKIFDPFFTTKDKFKGTGLGLSTVYGIVKQNQGTIHVYSEPQKGSTFKIYWPITGEDSPQIDPPQSSLPRKIQGGKILFVEDNEAVRLFTVEALRGTGYDVQEAANGKLALKKALEEKFDLIITDLIMPELKGNEFIERLHQVHPSAKVLFISGYADNHVFRNGMLKKGLNFLQKPYSIKALVEEIERILHEPPREESEDSDNFLLQNGAA